MRPPVVRTRPLVRLERRHRLPKPGDTPRHHLALRTHGPLPGHHPRPGEGPQRLVEVAVGGLDHRDVEVGPLAADPGRDRQAGGPAADDDHPVPVVGDLRPLDRAGRARRACCCGHRDASIELSAGRAGTVSSGTERHRPGHTAVAASRAQLQAHPTQRHCSMPRQRVRAGVAGGRGMARHRGGSRRPASTAPIGVPTSATRSGPTVLPDLDAAKPAVAVVGLTPCGWLPACLRVLGWPSPSVPAGPTPSPR